MVGDDEDGDGDDDDPDIDSFYRYLTHFLLSAIFILLNSPY